MKKSGRIRPNRARQKKRLERTHGPIEYREWIRRQPCKICGLVGFSVAAHRKTGGTGYKLGWEETFPLCSTSYRGGRVVTGCHEQYDGARKTFLKAHPAFDPIIAVAETRAEWIAESTIKRFNQPTDMTFVDPIQTDTDRVNMLADALAQVLTVLQLVDDTTDCRQLVADIAPSLRTAHRVATRLDPHRHRPSPFGTVNGLEVCAVQGCDFVRTPDATFWEKRK